jgi:SLOG in TRPM, prokaryote
MEIRPGHYELKVQDIYFPNGNCARAIFSPMDTNPVELLAYLNIPLFQPFFMIAGGALDMEEHLSPPLTHLFADGIANLAMTLDALIIDGGTHTGVMELMGLGIAKQAHKTPLLGVSPHGCVTYPGKPLTSVEKDAVLLDPNHSHFVLVESDEWGGETETMYKLAQMFSQSHPSVAFLINGGHIAQKEVLYNVRQKRPIIVIGGSGRVADQIIRLLQVKPSSISDPELAEIMQNGRIYPFPLNGSSADLIYLTHQLLNDLGK